MKKWNNYALLLCIIFLLVICVVSIYTPTKPETPANDKIETLQTDSTSNDTTSRYQNQ